MEFYTFDATKTSLYKNKLEGKSPIQQVAALAEVLNIMNDVFAFTYESEYYLRANEETFSKIISIRTGYQLFLGKLFKGVIAEAENGNLIDWSSVVYGAESMYFEVTELADTVERYNQSISCTLSLFDCFFMHDSNLGSTTIGTLQNCKEIRDFFLFILATALNDCLGEGNSKTIFCPISAEPGPDAESVYQ